MSDPLLGTKLYLPRPRSGLVARTRLRERLDRALQARLLLVSAPAGFGKTTLVVDWVHALGHGQPLGPGAGGVRTAWLALDDADNDPVTFWRYLVAAVGAAVPEIGDDAAALLQEPQPPPIQLVLTTLINRIEEVGVEIVAVLDDFHVIDAAAIRDGLVFLLDHLPPQVHLVIVSRADPLLPLPRLRARGELVEVRAADLRFTGDEASAYLNDAMGLRLGARDVETLEGRTEGWIAALQLAALSMAGREDVTSFIDGFAGDDRYVVDYLVDEVLDQQPAEVQTFLLRTSMLERMTGSLCEAVTGQAGGRAMLEDLDRQNLFLVALDDRRQWYRYHHLFADVLRGRLVDDQPDLLPRLHRSASSWFEDHGDVSEAIRHALAAADHARAADLVERALPELRRDRRETTLRSWLEALPRDVIRTRPVLGDGLAAALMATGTFAGAEALLDDAERCLDGLDRHQRIGEHSGTAAGTVVVDPDALRRLPGEIAVHRAGLALVAGDPSATTVLAGRALTIAAESDLLTRGAALALTGLAAWTTGDLGTAHSSYAACVAEFEKIEFISDVLGCTIALGDIEVTQGRLPQAMDTYRSALLLADNHRTPVHRGRADMLVGIADLHRETGDLAAARRALEEARALGEHAGLPQNAYRWRVAMAGLCEAEGDVAGALELLDEAESRYVGDFLPEVRPVAAIRARLQARHGHLEEAISWVERTGLSVTDDVDYLREFAHLTLARALLAHHVRTPGEVDLSAVADLLRRLSAAAAAGGRHGALVEISIVQALVAHRAGDLTTATQALGSALHAAEPQGYLRTFVDEGVAMTQLLEACRPTDAAHLVQRIRAALGGTPAIDIAQPRTAPNATLGLVEPLSARERDVLRLLTTELSGPEIARELVVSLNTVRTHTKNVYTKLGVTNRRSAVARARDLSLL